MLKIFAATAILAAFAIPALAQTTTPSPAPSMTAPVAPAPAATMPTTNAPGAPVAGANSFTEAQARARIEANGFSNVSGLAKDDKSVWRGTAMKDGKSVAVAVDYQGNVVAN
ncbi:MAG: PepSY domain-containing protein [Alphaproteobacteria bacterium]|nr:PepSY domain-containing protein [Alphaproteobacteria bacterium]